MVSLSFVINCVLILAVLVNVFSPWYILYWKTNNIKNYVFSSKDEPNLGYLMTLSIITAIISCVILFYDINIGEKLVIYLSNYRNLSINLWTVIILGLLFISHSLTTVYYNFEELKNLPMP